MKSQAQLALEEWQARRKTVTVAIPTVVKEFGGDPTADKDWQTRFYHFPDGSWIATKGAGKAHQAWHGPNAA